jgi:DNA-binding SARP family transcriptional activator
MSESNTRLSLLGPLRVERAGTTIELPQSKKARVLLAYLAVSGRPQTRNHLCGMLWENTDDPRGGLRWCLSRLRRVLDTDESSIVLADRSQVQLATDIMSVDILQVRALLRHGSEASIETLRAAADAFVGEFLDGLDLPDLHGVQSWLVAMRAEVRTLRQELLERVVECLQEKPAVAASYAQALTEHSPESEEAHVLLLRCLLEAGEKSQAKERYELALRELEASGTSTFEVRRLWRARRDADQAPSSTSDAEPERAAPFVGRSAELEVVSTLLDGLSTGKGGIVSISGEPGIGKTRFIEETSAIATGRDIPVLRGGCTNSAYAPPYLPFIEALDLPASREALDLPEQVHTLLGRVLPTLGEREGISAEETDIEGVDRYQVFRAFAKLLSALGAERGLLLVLEDLHWADTQSLLLLSYLGRLLRESKVVILVSYRQMEVSHDHALRSALDAIRREPSHVRIELQRLDDQAAMELIAQNGLSEKLHDVVHRQTAGHPLFILEIIRHLLEAEASNTGLPEGIREVIGRRLAHIGTDCKKVLSKAAVLTGDIPWMLLCTLAKIDEDELLDLLDEALSAGLIRERTGAEGGSYEFTHALIRQCLYEDLSTSRRLRLHAQVGAAIESTYSRSVDKHLSDLAHHYFEAAPIGHMSSFVDFSIRAGRNAMAQLAFEEAADLFGRALHTIEELEAEIDSDTLVLLFESHASALTIMNQWAAAKKQLELALQNLEPDQELHQARLLLDSAVCEFWNLNIEAVRTLANRALSLDKVSGDAQLVSAGTALLGQVLVAGGDVHGGAANYKKAEEISGSNENLLTIQARQQQVILHYWRGQFDAAVDSGARFMEVGRAHSDGSMVMNLFPLMALSHACAGRYRLSAQLFAEAAEYGRDHNINHMMVRASALQVASAFEVGAYQVARDISTQALEKSTGLDFKPTIVSAQFDLLFLDLAEGQLARAQAALPTVESSVHATGGFHQWVWAMRLVQAQGQIALMQRDWSTANEKAAELQAQAERYERIKYQIFAKQIRAAARQGMGDLQPARSELVAAQELAESISYPALQLQVAADLLRLEPDTELARRSYERLQMIRDELTESPWLACLDASPGARLISEVHQS